MLYRRNGRGGDDIAGLSEIAVPDEEVITSIGPAHLDGFGDLSGAARGKTSLFRAVPAVVAVI